MSEWKPIKTAPKDRPILLAGKWGRFGQSWNWDYAVGEWLANRFPFVGSDGPTHWKELEPPKALSISEQNAIKAALFDSVKIIE